MKVDFAFLDSGTGGIPYMLHLKKISPESSCLYLADSKNFPYGEKSNSEIISCSKSAVNKIINSWNPRVIVVACNTISVTALDSLRKSFPDTPIVGTVPAIKLAAEVTKNHKIGLLATNATVNHQYVKKLASDFASGCSVVMRGDAELVSFIEHKLFTASKDEKRAAVRPAVDFFASYGCDTIVLGCTHFLHLADVIASEAGSSVKVVDSREGVARQALRMYESEKKKSACRNECKKNISEISVADESLFVTGFTKNDDKKEYTELCKNLFIPFGGLLNPQDIL